MPNVYIGALLPVFWAIVATIIGLALYKTSKAFFEERRQSEGRTKRIRLVGSVVIAAVAFIGMRYATPASVLEPVPKDAVLISMAELRAAKDQARKSEDSLLALGSCLSLEAGANCRDQYDAVTAEVGETSRMVKQLGPSGRP